MALPTWLYAKLFQLTLIPLETSCIQRLAHYNVLKTPEAGTGLRVVWQDECVFEAIPRNLGQQRAVATQLLDRGVRIWIEEEEARIPRDCTKELTTCQRVVSRSNRG